MRIYFATLVLCTGCLAAADLRTELVFHADFDKSADARVGGGDKRLYSAASYKEQDKAVPGLAGTDVEWADGALRFKKKNTKAVFFQAAGNLPFDGKNWTGTIGFRLRLDPETDLEPGFCDPIQVTDKAYNDSAIWVDFTKDDKPRHFRLGVFGELKAWNSENIAPDKNPAFMNRLVVVKQTPFRRDKWTHVAITYEKLGSGAGRARLYLDGKLQGETPALAEVFSWDIKKGAIRLGVNYVGLLDDVTVFGRALSAAEVARIAAGKW